MKTLKQIQEKMDEMDKEVRQRSMNNLRRDEYRSAFYGELERRVISIGKVAALKWLELPHMMTESTELQDALRLPEKTGNEFK